MYKRDIYRLIFLSLLLVVPLLIFFAPLATGAALGLMWTLAPLWLPIALFLILVPLWITYIQSQYASSVVYTVLELKPGNQTPKTARAMELVFYSLYHRVDISRTMMVLVGQTRLSWSFEIVAHNGTVRFFMRIPRDHRSAVESRLRAEYRDIDIDEVPDYARLIQYHPLSMQLEAREFTFTKPDPYPIEVYETYESDKKRKNPYTDLLEKMVALGPDEYLMISYMVRPHQRERKTPWSEPVDSLHEDAQREIGTIVGPEGNIGALSEDTRDLIKAIEAGLKKPSFDCGIRAVYVGKRDAVNQQNIFLLDSLLSGFEIPNRNGFQAYDARTSLSWPLSDIARAIPGFSDWYMFYLYRRRAFFAPPYFGKVFILNTAELATLFHLPHITHASPLARARGKRLEPPENLPILS